MKFNTILRQFEAALKRPYADRLLPGICQAIQALSGCRTEAAGAMKLHCPDWAMKHPFNRVPARIEVVPDVKIMKPHNGLTVNLQNYCRSSISGSDLSLAP